MDDYLQFRFTPDDRESGLHERYPNFSIEFAERSRLLSLAQWCNVHMLSSKSLYLPSRHWDDVQIFAIDAAIGERDNSSELDELLIDDLLDGL